MDGAPKLRADRRVELEGFAERALGHVNDDVGAQGLTVVIALDIHNLADEVAPGRVAIHGRERRVARRERCAHN